MKMILTKQKILENMQGAGKLELLPVDVTVALKDARNELQATLQGVELKQAAQALLEEYLAKECTLVEASTDYEGKHYTLSEFTEYVANSPEDVSLSPADTPEELAAAYKDIRKLHYDKLNQFDLQFNDRMDGTTTWVDAIQEIKTRFPKGDR